MGFSYVIKDTSVFGNKRIAVGTYTNTPTVAQIDTFTIGGTVEADDVYTVTVDSNDVDYTVLGSEEDLEAVMDALISAINLDATVGAIVLAEKLTANTFKLTAEVPGTAFVSLGAATNGGATDDNTLVGVTTTPNGSISTGGDIVTGLKSVDFIELQPTGSAVNTNNPVINESFPLSSGSVTIVTDADADGVWFAIGL